jgi:hypothetical protein
MIEQPASTAQYCVNHPQRETLLRCNRCERPICTECAVLTPTGYRCKDCVRGQQKIFNTAQWYDYPLAAVIGGGLALAGSLLVSFVGFFTLFIAPIVGMAIAEVVRWATRRRRSYWLWRTALIATVIGALLLPLLGLLGGLFLGGGFSLWGLIWSGAYALLCASSMYYRLSGIQIR